jgi:membrane protein YfhO
VTTVTDAGVRRGAAAWTAAGLLGLLIAFAFRDALAGRLFYLRDVVQNHAPVRRMVTDRLLSGELPLWDPLHGGGVPLLANPNHLVLHPITLLFLLLPFDAAMTASIVLQFVVLAAGGYLLARDLAVGRPAAVLAAALLALSGPAASLSSQQNVLSAFAWLPLALWGFGRAVRGPGAVPRIAAVAASAVIFMTGEAASALALVVLAPVIALTAPAGGTAPRRRAAVTIAAGLAVAALLAAVQILPARELLAGSPRATGLAPAEAMKWSLQPERLAEVVLPGLFGDPTRLAPDSWWGGGLFEGGYPFLLSLVVGAGACLLAVVALGRGPGRGRAIGLAAAAAFFVTLALGSSTPVYRGLAATLPAARQVRYPERFMLGALVALALLASIGLERVDRRRSGSRAQRLFWAATGLFVAAAAWLGLAHASGEAALVRFLRLPAAVATPHTLAAVRAGVTGSLLWAAGEAAILALATLALARGGRPARAAVWGVAAALGLSCALASAPARATTPSDWMHAASPLRDLVASGAGGPRLHHAPRPAGLQIRAESDAQEWGYRFDRFTYSLMTGHPDGVPTILDPATDRMDLAVPVSIGARLAALAPDEQVRILRLAHAGWLLSWDAVVDPGLRERAVFDGMSRPALHVYEVEDVPARIRFVGRAEPPADAMDPMASLLDPDFDPASSVLIEAEGGEGSAHRAGTAIVPASAPLEAKPAVVRVLQDDPERLTIEVAAGRPGVLVVDDSWAPGWQARLDGEPIPILRTNMMFRGVEVPAGRHEVIMVYRPASLFTGALVSALGLACLAGYSVRPRVAA